MEQNQIYYRDLNPNILQRFKPTEFPGHETSSAIIIELSAIYDVHLMQLLSMNLLVKFMHTL